MSSLEDGADSSYIAEMDAGTTGQMQSSPAGEMWLCEERYIHRKRASLGQKHAELW